MGKRIRSVTKNIPQTTFNTRANSQKASESGLSYTFTFGDLSAAEEVGQNKQVLVCNGDSAVAWVAFGDSSLAAPSAFADGIMIPAGSCVILASGLNTHVRGSASGVTRATAEDATTQFDVTKVGDVVTYTYDGTGTAPLFVTNGVVVGDRLTVGATSGFDPDNEVTNLEITAVTETTVEVTNAAGVVESNIVLGDANAWTIVAPSPVGAYVAVEDITES